MPNRPPKFDRGYEVTSTQTKHVAEDRMKESLPVNNSKKNTEANAMLKTQPVAASKVPTANENTIENETATKASTKPANVSKGASIKGNY